MAALLKHLRELQESRHCFMPGLVRDAADEIERLRQQVNELEDAADEYKQLHGFAVNGFSRLTEELATLKRQGEPYIYFDPDAFALSRERPMRPTYIALYTSAPTIPDGYVLVPVDPTPEMFDAAEVAFENGSEGIWHAMIAAAQIPTGERG